MILRYGLFFQCPLMRKYALFWGCLCGVWGCLDSVWVVSSGFWHMSWGYICQIYWKQLNKSRNIHLLLLLPAASKGPKCQKSGNQKSTKVIFFLQLDPMLFWVFGPKLTKKSPPGRLPVNSNFGGLPPPPNRMRWLWHESKTLQLTGASISW